MSRQHTPWTTTTTTCLEFKPWPLRRAGDTRVLCQRVPCGVNFLEAFIYISCHYMVVQWMQFQLVTYQAEVHTQLKWERFCFTWHSYCASLINGDGKGGKGWDFSCTCRPASRLLALWEGSDWWSWAHHVIDHGWGTWTVKWSHVVGVTLSQESSNIHITVFAAMFCAMRDWFSNLSFIP